MNEQEQLEKLLQEAEEWRDSLGDKEALHSDLDDILVELVKILANNSKNKELILKIIAQYEEGSEFFWYA